MDFKNSSSPACRPWAFGPYGKTSSSQAEERRVVTEGTSIGDLTMSTSPNPPYFADCLWSFGGLNDTESSNQEEERRKDSEEQTSVADLRTSASQNFP